MSNDTNINNEINELIKEYAYIRRKFEICKKKYSRYLEGNDNYIGIIGEYWATIFLEQIYERNSIEDYLEMKTNKYSNKDTKLCGISYSNSTEWLDFIVKHENKSEFISVKTISSENKQRKSGKIKYPVWKKEAPTCDYILSVIILKLDKKKLEPEQLLYINDLNKNLENCKGKKYNYSDHWHKGKNSLVFKYYKNDGFDKIFSSKIWVWENNKFVQKGPL